MRLLIYWLFTCLLLSAAEQESPDQELERIAFGSCYRPGRNPEIWQAIGAHKPDLFIFAGDNIYADTTDPRSFRRQYEALLQEKPFQHFRRQHPVIATWDDHDYGRNNAGADFPAKALAKNEYLRAFPQPRQHPIHSRDGIYHSYRFGPPGRRVQVLMLDTRWFRSPLKIEGVGPLRKIQAQSHPDATILGPAQWKWLRQQLQEEADLRIIVSSIQVLATEHRFEKWANFPLELKRLTHLLSTATQAPCLILSGDRHMGEIMQTQGLSEVTSSGLTQAGGGSPTEANSHRVAGPVSVRNFGLLTIKWTHQGPAVQAQLMDATGGVLAARQLLNPPRKP